jgi:hypothetical protein
MNANGWWLLLGVALFLWCFSTVIHLIFSIDQEKRDGIQEEKQLREEWNAMKQSERDEWKRAQKESEAKRRGSNGRAGDAKEQSQSLYARQPPASGAAAASAAAAPSAAESTHRHQD